MSKFNCPHCSATETYCMPAWEALGQVEECNSCGERYVFEDSEGGPNALVAVAIDKFRGANRNGEEV